MGSLSPQPSPPLSSKVIFSSWKLHPSSEDLVDWKKQQQKLVLHFHGASKKNPRVEGGEWVLLNPDGIIETKYAWGLGRKTNNQVEMYGFLHGLHIAKDKEIKDIVILGDSLITSHYLIPLHWCFKE